MLFWCDCRLLTRDIGILLLYICTAAAKLSEYLRSLSSERHSYRRSITRSTSAIALTRSIALACSWVNSPVVSPRTDLMRCSETRNDGSVNMLAILILRRRLKYSSSAGYSSMNVKNVSAPSTKRVGQLSLWPVLLVFSAHSSVCTFRVRPAEDWCWQAL